MDRKNHCKVKKTPQGNITLPHQWNDFWVSGLVSVPFLSSKESRLKLGEATSLDEDMVYLIFKFF